MTHQQPKKSSELPATQGMLYELRAELKSDITSLSLKLDCKTDEVKSEINGVRSEVHGLKSEINEVRSEIFGVKSEIDGLKSEVNGVKSEVAKMSSAMHRMTAMFEEMTHQNKYVLDGYMAISTRQDRTENEIKDIKKTLATF